MVNASITMCQRDGIRLIIDEVEHVKESFI